MAQKTIIAICIGAADRLNRKRRSKSSVYLRHRKVEIDFMVAGVCSRIQ